MNIQAMTIGHAIRHRVFQETQWTPRTEITMKLMKGTWTILVDKSDRTERYVWEFPTEDAALDMYNGLCAVVEAYQARTAN